MTNALPWAIGAAGVLVVVAIVALYGRAREAEGRAEERAENAEGDAEKRREIQDIEAESQSRAERATWARRLLDRRRSSR